MKSKVMKTRILIMLSVAALMSLSCAPKKSVEEKLAEFTQWNKSFEEDFRAKMMSLQDNPEAARAYYDSAMVAYLEYNKSALMQNLDNAVGVAALKEVYGDMEDDELIPVLEQLTAPLEEKDSIFVSRLREALEVRAATAVGQPFKDFTVEHVSGVDKAGNPIIVKKSLSDFVGKGKLMLVDFWSPWCPPCKAELPNIKAVWEKYHGDAFDVLSVAVWEESRKMTWRNTIDTAAVYGVTWNQLNNGHQEPASLYGIQGIPHMILFAPDGTILARGESLRGDALDPAIAQALGK